MSLPPSPTPRSITTTLAWSWAAFQASKVPQCLESKWPGSAKVTGPKPCQGFLSHCLHIYKTQKRLPANHFVSAGLHAVEEHGHQREHQHEGSVQLRRHILQREGVACTRSQQHHHQLTDWTWDPPYMYLTSLSLCSFRNYCIIPRFR